MKKLKARELGIEEFALYGTFARTDDDGAYHFGEPPVQFFRDLLKLELGGAGSASFSVCRVSHRPLIVDKTEFHSRTGEGILPLDGDIIIHVGPASRRGALPLDRFEAFRVPRGVLVSLKPGVWHHAPFALNQPAVNVLIVLPERTYANDCEVVELDEKQKLEIEP